MQEGKYPPVDLFLFLITSALQRWLHSLSPNVKKTAWTKEEDNLLLELYKIHSAKWAVIARNIPGRTDDACSKRYREALDPSLKKDDWTSDEDEKLIAAYNSIGGKWGRVGQELQRSGLGCRNRSYFPPLPCLPWLLTHLPGGDFFSESEPPLHLPIRAYPLQKLLPTHPTHFARPSLIQLLPSGHHSQ